MKLTYYLDRDDSAISSIFARICYSGKNLKFYPGESVQTMFWDQKGQKALDKAKEEIKGKNPKTIKYPQAPELNARLGNIKASVERVFLQWKNEHSNTEPHPSDFKALLNKTLKNSESVPEKNREFLGFFTELIKRTEAGQRVLPKGERYSVNTVKAYKSTLLRVKQFSEQSRRRVNFDTIDQEFYDKFIFFLQKTHNLKNSAIGKHVKIIRLVLNESHMQGLHSNLTYKARSFAVFKEPSRSSVYLNEKELEEILAIDLSKNKRLERVRDLFIVGCHTGLRFSDLSRLQPDNFKNGSIDIVTQKTGEVVNIPEHSTVKAIREKYNGQIPKAISNQKANEYLKQLFKDIPTYSEKVETAYTKGGLRVNIQVPKFELITSHTARRSFATNATLAGIPAFLIMKITGHRSEKAFRDYIKLSSREYGELFQIHMQKSKLKAV